MSVLIPEYLLRTSLRPVGPTLVRESASRNLKFLYRVDKSKGLQLARIALDDNERVRGNLVYYFLNYLFSIDKDNCLELYKIALYRQNGIVSEETKFYEM